MREWLKTLRENKQLTQQNVADMLGISKQYYQLIEAHERQKKMDITLMTKLSDIFGVSFNEIVQQEKALTDKIAYNESRKCQQLTVRLNGQKMRGETYGHTKREKGDNSFESF